MGSFNGSRRNQGPGRRRDGKGQRGRSPHLEALEMRTLLDGGGGIQTPPAWKPTSQDPTDVKNGPLARGGQNTVQVYLDYQKYLRDGAVGTFAASHDNTESKLIRFQGNNIGIDISGFGDFSTFATAMRNVGMNITASDSKHEIVEGWL